MLWFVQQSEQDEELGLFGLGYKACVAPKSVQLLQTLSLNVASQTCWKAKCPYCKLDPKFVEI